MRAGSRGSPCSASPPSPSAWRRERQAAGTTGWGSYTVSGTTFTFDIANDGTAPLQSFTLLGPPGSAFLGGATAGESTAPCSVGQPDGDPNEIECGPLSTAGLAPGAELLFVGAMSTAAACGQPFQLEATTTLTTAPIAVGAIGPAGACSPPPPAAAAPCAAPPTGSLSVLRARLTGLDGLAAALGQTWSAAETSLSAARLDLLAAASAAPAGESASLVRAITRGVTASASAQARLVTLEADDQALGREASAALSGLAAQAAALAACQNGPAATQAPPAGTGATGCGVERAALASSSAEVQIVARASGRIGQATLDLLPARLRQAASLLSAAAGQTPAPAFARERRNAVKNLSGVGATHRAGPEPVPRWRGRGRRARARTRRALGARTVPGRLTALPLVA